MTQRTKRISIVVSGAEYGILIDALQRAEKVEARRQNRSDSILGRHQLGLYTGLEEKLRLAYWGTLR